MINRLIQYAYKLITKADKKRMIKEQTIKEDRSYLLKLQEERSPLLDEPLYTEQSFMPHTPFSDYTKPMGFNDPIQALDSCEVLCRCKNCGTSWHETRHNVYVTKNSAWEYDKCSKCTDLTKVQYDKVISKQGKVTIK